MKKGGGRAKGSAFERQIAKLLVETFKDHGITQKDCYRTPLSGGHKWASKTDPGDIMMSPKLRKLFPFVIECKSYNRLNWRELFSPLTAAGTGQFSKWWRQAALAAVNLNGEPLLIFKENRSEPFCMYRIVNDESYQVAFPFLETKIGTVGLVVTRLSKILHHFRDKADESEES